MKHQSFSGDDPDDIAYQSVMGEGRYQEIDAISCLIASAKQYFALSPGSVGLLIRPMIQEDRVMFPANMQSREK